MSNRNFFPMVFGQVDPYIMISHRLESLILELSKIAR